MLLRVILLLSIFIMSKCIHAQTEYKQIIRDELTISFPSEPEHKVIDEKGKEAYILHLEGCSFMTGVAPDAIDDYGSYLKTSDSEQVARALRTLEGVAMGKINAKNQYLISMKSFQSGSNIGLDVEYATFEPSNPKSRKRFSTLLLIKNTLYIFDCWYMDDKDHSAERDKFFGSISLKG